MCAELGVAMHTVDIDTDPPDLQARYTTLVPVTVIDGREHDHWRVDEERLRAALGASTCALTGHNTALDACAELHKVLGCWCDDDPPGAQPPHAIPAASLARLALYRGRSGTTAPPRGGDGVLEHPGRVGRGGESGPVAQGPVDARLVGTRGVGYEVATLVAELDGHIGSARDWHIVLIGIGNLGRALVGHAGLLTRGFSVAALFDNDPTVIGTEVEGHPVHPMQELAAVVTDPDRCIAVIATPPPQAAQTVVEELVAVGLKSVLNFTPGRAQGPRRCDGPPRRPGRRVADSGVPSTVVNGRAGGPYPPHPG